MSCWHCSIIILFCMFYFGLIVAGAVARGLCESYFFVLFCLFCPCWGGVGWGNNVHVRLLSDVMLR